MPATEGAILTNPSAKSKEEWIAYLTLVLRLIKLSLDAAKDDKVVVVAACRRFLPMKLLVKMIEECFTLEF